MKIRTCILAGALALACLAAPAKADWLGNVFGARSARFAAARSRPPLLVVASRYIGARNFTGVSRWCAAAMRHWLHRAGYRALASNRAMDYARYGRPATRLSPGAILVWRHHVGVYAGNGLTISGNGRGHRVHLGRHSLRGLIAMRAPA